MNLDGWWLVRYSIGVSLGPGLLDLSGTTLAPGEYLVLAKNQAAFEARWGTGISNVLYSSLVDVNGDDVLALEYDSVVYDIYGEIGVDGTGEAWEYTDSCAIRSAGVVANPVWAASEWTIDSNTSSASPGADNQVCGDICGDINGDGMVNMADLVFITNYLNGVIVLDACQIWAADLDADGDVDADDQTALSNHIVTAASTTSYPGCM
jgi:hypothetical protein